MTTTDRRETGEHRGEEAKERRDRSWSLATPDASPLVLGLLFGVTAVLAGIVLAFGGPIAGAAVVLGGLSAILVLRNIELGFFAVIAVVALLPFATLPVDIGLTPTFLDFALGAVVVVWLLGIVTGRQRRIVTAPVALPLILFIFIAIFAFIFGLANGPLTATLLRKFAELLLSLGFVLIVIDYCRTWERLERLVKFLLLMGAAAAVVAIGLWLLPEDAANSALNALTRVGYPGGWVIRYIEENPELSERAIGTSVDPNSLGGLLLMMGALVGPQMVTKRPLFRRRVIWIIGGLVFLGLILTFSRGAMLGLAAGLGLVAVARYRRLLPYMAVVAVIILLLPFAQEYVARFVEGFQGDDLATQMRFGEYRDAMRLIARYPVFGVGFAGTPDIDLYLAVASVYFTIAGRMGLFGLLAFFGIVGTVFIYAFRNRKAARADEHKDAVWLGLHAALLGALVAGIFDHYLFNMDFHHAVTIFWMMLGMAVAATRLVTEPDTSLEVISD
ncbi:MAG: O-antigen ligase family protein [Anaerolineae bacterium]|nr:O-antigen ligase family protein [Anaerolineae bacterium]